MVDWKGALEIEEGIFMLLLSYLLAVVHKLRQIQYRLDRLWTAFAHCYDINKLRRHFILLFFVQMCPDRHERGVEKLPERDTKHLSLCGKHSRCQCGMAESKL